MIKKVAYCVAKNQVSAGASPSSNVTEDRNANLFLSSHPKHCCGKALFSRWHNNPLSLPSTRHAPSLILPPPGLAPSLRAPLLQPRPVPNLLPLPRSDFFCSLPTQRQTCLQLEKLPPGNNVIYPSASTTHAWGSKVAMILAWPPQGPSVSALQPQTCSKTLSDSSAHSCGNLWALKLLV